MLCSSFHGAPANLQFSSQLEQERRHRIITSRELAMLRDQLSKMQALIGTTKKKLDIDQDKCNETQHTSTAWTYGSGRVTVETRDELEDEQDEERIQQYLKENENLQELP